MRYNGKFEYAEARKIRERNTRLYRTLHLPIWIWVFFLAPGPLTFSLFAHGFTWSNGVWLAAVLAGTIMAGLRGRLPGVEPRPYILRFDEDKPNPLSRKICYTFAWNAVLSFALLNLSGLAIAAFTGERRNFYGSVWAVTIAQTLLLVVWKILPSNVGPTQTGSQIKLFVFAGSLLFMGLATWRGMLPRTRPIMPGELMVSEIGRAHV